MTCFIIINFLKSWRLLKNMIFYSFVFLKNSLILQQKELE